MSSPAEQLESSGFVAEPPPEVPQVTWCAEIVHPFAEYEVLRGPNERFLAHRRTEAGMMPAHRDVGISRLRSSEGSIIELTLGTAAHVAMRHMKSDSPSGIDQFSSDLTIEDLMRLSANSMEGALEYLGRHTEVQIETDRVIGLPRAVSVMDALEDGAMTLEQYEALEDAAPEIARINVCDDMSKKAEFAWQFNQVHGGERWRLGIRKGMLVPNFAMEPQPTTSFVLAVRRGRPTSGQFNEVRTMYPGRRNPHLPTSKSLENLQGLARREAEGFTLKDSERVLLHRYQRAQEDWLLEYGFIVDTRNSRLG